jgi:hypothetical protein
LVGGVVEAGRVGAVVVARVHREAVGRGWPHGKTVTNPGATGSVTVTFSTAATANGDTPPLPATANCSVPPPPRAPPPSNRSSTVPGSIPGRVSSRRAGVTGRSWRWVDTSTTRFSAGIGTTT